MRYDGELTYFVVQHRYEGEEEWYPSDLGEFIFREMSHADKQSEQAKFISEQVFKKQDMFQRGGPSSAFSEQWPATLGKICAEAAVLKYRPRERRDVEFRVAKITTTKKTEVVA